MATLLSFLIAFGFYSFYLTSNRVDYIPPALFVRGTCLVPRFGTILGWGAFLLGIFLSSHVFGVGSGVLFFFIVLMTSGSLIVILAPLGFLTMRVVLPALLCMFVLELIIR